MGTGGKMVILVYNVYKDNITKEYDSLFEEDF